MPSDTSLLISAWTRPLYLKRVLASWAQVPEVKDLRTVTIALGQSGRMSDQRAVIAAAAQQDAARPEREGGDAVAPQ